MGSEMLRWRADELESARVWDLKLADFSWKPLLGKAVPCWLLLRRRRRRM